MLATGLRLPRPARVLFLIRLAALAIVLAAVITLSDLHGPAQVLVLLVAHLALPAGRTALVTLLLAMTLVTPALTPAVTQVLLSALMVEVIALIALAALVILVVTVHTLLVGLAHLFVLALLIALLGALCVLLLAPILAHDDLLSVVSVSNALPFVSGLRKARAAFWKGEIPGISGEFAGGVTHLSSATNPER